MMRARTWFTVTALAASLLTGAARAESSEEKTFYITPFIGWTLFDNDRRFSSGQELTDDVYFGGRVGARLSDLFLLDLAGGYTGTKDCLGCTESWTHFSGNLMWSPASPNISPFLSLGGGVSNFQHELGPAEKAGTFEAAAGLRMRLGSTIGIRLEARNVLALDHQGHDDIVLGTGLTFAFGDRSDPLDDDGDGVFNDRDKCPNTPLGCRVDADGCPSDSDGDGVCDGKDQCADTPAGARVDSNGCPSDSDGDGVLDGIDECPNTPSGCSVDARGCPSDSDGDGVCDGLDRCSDTPSGTTVDSQGCPLSEREMELLNTGMIRLTNVHFDYDKSTIRPDAHAVLDSVGEVLTKWPGLNIEIRGHTDSRGSEQYNHDLSHRRAEAVRAYLLNRFTHFQPTQLTAKGFGESEPVAPNTSEEGMAQNRRVEFVVLNKEILRQAK